MTGSTPPIYLASSNYPQSYSANQDCIWALAGDPGGTFRIRIFDLDMESYDILSIGYGNDINEVSEVSRLTLWNFPETILIDKKNVWVHFYSNGAVQFGGFILKIEWSPTRGMTRKNYFRHHISCSKLKLKITQTAHRTQM